MVRQKIAKARFIKEVSVTDPDSGLPVELEVWKDPESGGMFAMDASFLEQVADRIPNPFNPGGLLTLDDHVAGELHECQNCETKWAEDQLVPLSAMKGLLERVAPGESMPSGECPDPDCGAVCHPVAGKTRIITLERVIAGDVWDIVAIEVPKNMTDEDARTEAVRRAEILARHKGDDVSEFRACEAEEDGPGLSR